MKCFYHSSDFDGKCSGAIINYLFGPDDAPKIEDELTLHPINYGQDFPWDIIKENEIVFMVDFSLQPFSDMERLNDMCVLVWIDHHQEALKEAEKSEVKFRREKYRRIGIGACALVWEFAAKSYGLGPMPEAVRLLAEYDVWNHKNPKTLPFQYGLRSYKNTGPENLEFWEKVFYDSSFLEEVIKRGEPILAYEKEQLSAYAKSSFETKIEGLTAIALNRNMAGSMVFDSVYKEGTHDVMIRFGWKNGEWDVSLYSTEESGVDVGAIASKFGGGGHKGAAGFQCKELPFKLV